MEDAGITPDYLTTSCPPRNTARVGMARIFKRDATSGRSSVLTLATSQCPRLLHATLATSGATIFPGRTPWCPEVHQHGQGGPADECVECGRATSVKAVHPAATARYDIQCSEKHYRGARQANDITFHFWGMNAQVHVCPVQRAKRP